MKRSNQADQYAKFIAELINGIDLKESTEWANETRDVSINIRQAVVGQLDKMNVDRKNNRITADDRFMDYCNAVKSLLVIYNFGNLPTEDDIALSKEDYDQNMKEYQTRLNYDKNLIRSGIIKILKHVQNGTGYDITPYLAADECLDIFKSPQNPDKVVPVTISATTVFTTLVYLRRAIKRLGLFTESELIVDGFNINEAIVATMAELLAFMYGYVRDNSFEGWGVTLDPKFSRAVTLNDTYSVVDAISRFADATTKEGLKADPDFLKALDEYGNDKLGIEFLTSRSISAIYKVAFTVYDRTKNVYGKEKSFYVVTKKENDKIVYDYPGTNYSQIASSNRSSALFNPLYIAMITMYGYNDKEVVIRNFMDDPLLVNSFYNKYEKNSAVTYKISDYAANEMKFVDFPQKVGILLDENHLPMSSDYSTKEDERSWRAYYDLARVFQKYLEKYHPDDLMELSSYRDYLNATKDAIDQVALLYRDFENNQRLGVVDTDYVMYSEYDVAIKRDDKASIPKLNKANIAVNNLRPMMLSSKIMIINALTKYPQSDIKSLYNAIKSKRHQKVEKGKKTDEWLWNEDNVDMNSTARHCEAIAYDYFDYYEKYEIGFTAMRTLKSQLEIDQFEKAIDPVEGTLESADLLDDATDAVTLKNLIVELTRQNVALIKDIYQKNLSLKDNAIKRLNDEAELQQQQAKQAIDELNKKHAEEIEELKLQYRLQNEKKADSYNMGEELKQWIRNEIESYFKQTFALSMINKLNNGNASAENFDMDNLIKSVRSNDNKVISARYPFVEEAWKNMSAILENDGAAALEEEYTEKFRDAIVFADMISAGTDGIFESEHMRNLYKNRTIPIDQRNNMINQDYNYIKRYGKTMSANRTDENKDE